MKLHEFPFIFENILKTGGLGELSLMVEHESLFFIFFSLQSIVITMEDERNQSKYETKYFC